MKKVITFIMLFVAVFLVISPVTAFATEIGSNPTAAEGGYHDIFTRIYEFVVANKAEVISGAGSAVVLAFSAIMKSFSKKQGKELKGLIESVGADASGTAKNQQSLIDAFNVMAKGYNEMREAYERYECVEDDRNRLVGACLVTNTALLEMFSTAFIHNKNLPQGVKDLVVLEYANTKKALSDDEVLKAVVESVREKVTGTEGAAENEKQD